MIPIFFLSTFYFLTRIPFIHTFPLYYDSFEYVRIGEKLNWGNLVAVISGSHQPIHTLYFITCYAFKLLFPYVSVEASMALLSLFFGYATVLIWYVILKNYFETKRALFGAVILSLFPHFFTVTTNIAYESEYLFFQAAGFFFLVRGIKNKKNIFIFLSGLFLGCSHLIFIGALFIIPIFILSLITVILGIPTLLGDSRIKKGSRLSRGDIIQHLVFVGLFFLGYFISGFAFDYLFLASLPLVIAKYTSHAGDVVSTSQGPLLFLGRVVRNIVLQSKEIVSWGGVFLTVFSVFVLMKRKSSYGMLLLIVTLPFLILMQYWHAGLFGRLALGIVFPISFLLVTVSNTMRKIGIAFCTLLIFLIIHLSTQLDAPPLYRYYKLIKQEKNIAVITSDYNRFIYEKNNIPHFVIKGDTQIAAVKTYVMNNLKLKRVLIDSAALRYPYYQYDGMQFHAMSQNKKGVPIIDGLLANFSYTTYRRDSNSDIYFLLIKNER